MDRASYNKCVGEGMRGKKLTKEERKKEFCITAKTCSGKASSRGQAAQMCEISLSQPREPKTTKQRRVPRSRSCAGMRVVLLTTTDCKPCTAAKQYLQKHMDKGLIEELNVQKSDEAADLAAKYGFGSVPKLLVLDDEGIPFSELQVTDTEQTI